MWGGGRSGSGISSRAACRLWKRDSKLLSRPFSSSSTLFRTAKRPACVRSSFVSALSSPSSSSPALFPRATRATAFTRNLSFSSSRPSSASHKEIVGQVPDAEMVSPSSPSDASSASASSSASSSATSPNRSPFKPTRIGSNWTVETDPLGPVEDLFWRFSVEEIKASPHLTKKLYEAMLYVLMAKEDYEEDQRRAEERRAKGEPPSEDQPMTFLALDPRQEGGPMQLLVFSSEERFKEFCEVEKPDMELALKLLFGEELLRRLSTSGEGPRDILLNCHSKDGEKYIPWKYVQELGSDETCAVLDATFHSDTLAG
ncbi:hypothetical protein QOT17_006979 [Balamuthia mandrillaris]